MKKGIREVLYRSSHLSWWSRESLSPSVNPIHNANQVIIRQDRESWFKDFLISCWEGRWDCIHDEINTFSKIRHTSSISDVAPTFLKELLLEQHVLRLFPTRFISFLFWKRKKYSHLTYIAYILVTLTLLSRLREESSLSLSLYSFICRLSSSSDFKREQKRNEILNFKRWDDDEKRVIPFALRVISCLFG